ncbi:Uu.00g057750.m01.CDS01 [Anthostomella pinea]|uniref:Uu.00g057750.m01.CDS01 n=1 Tax=Anthostomella pinea TaxID=933095 RepID=A0AAI8YMB6_9PEZI|nr:Uu.00g057750.m01.CDS01 [Anthostomella pinea]
MFNDREIQSQQSILDSNVWGHAPAHETALQKLCRQEFLKPDDVQRIRELMTARSPPEDEAMGIGNALTGSNEDAGGLENEIMSIIDEATHVVDAYNSNNKSNNQASGNDNSDDATAETSEPRYYARRICGALKNTKNSRYDHERGVHVGTICLFPGCGAMEATEGAMAAHLREVHRYSEVQLEGQTKFQCGWPGCSKIFPADRSAGRCVQWHQTAVLRNTDQDE